MNALEPTCSPIAYLHDGTLEGLLSSVFLAYERREAPDDIVARERYQPRIGQVSVLVDTDCSRAERVRKGVVRKAGTCAFTAIMRASTCDDYDAGAIVFRFVRFVMARSEADRARPVLDDLANPVVADIARLERRVVNECEKVRQFVRFSHLENGVWFARCKPSCSVVPLVMGHFAARFNDQPFIIYDENHHVAGVYDRRSWQLVEGDAVSPSRATEHDARVREAWKRFYDTLSVDARYNPELRRRFIPVRLWSTLPEMQPRRS